MDKELLAQLASRSNVGRDNFNGPSIPTVKLDGSSTTDTAGHFMMFNGTEVTDLGTSIVVQILRTRKKLLKGGEDSKYFTGEYDSSTHDQIELKRCTKGADGKWSKPEIVSTGTADQLRQVTDVKVASVVYCLLNGMLVKLIVKGASTTGDTGFYEYVSSFTGVHVFQFNTEISVSLVSKNRAIKYNRMVFKRGEEITEGFEKLAQYFDMIEGNRPDAPVDSPVVEKTNDEDEDGW